MILKQLKVFADCREDIIIFCLFRGILGNMKSICFLIANNLCLRLILSTLRHSANQPLIFCIFVDFVSYLSNDVIDFVAEFNDEFMALQAKVLFCPYQLILIRNNKLTQSRIVLYSLIYSLHCFPLYRWMSILVRLCSNSMVFFAFNLLILSY
jgi:hypothetical protein